MTTRAQAEAILIRRCGDLLTQAGLDGTTVDGTNPDLADPIATAVRGLGYATADPSAPTTAEVQAIPAADTDQLLDLAELRTLETVLAYVLDLVNTAVGPRREEYAQLANGLQLKIDRKALAVRRAYGAGLGSLEAGTLTLDFAQHNEE